MHWLNLIVVAFLYALIGLFVGIVYALLTGADMSSRANVVAIAGFFGPMTIVVIAIFRKLARESDIPITRAIYHTLILTVAAPVLLCGAQLIAGALDAPKVARLFEVLKYWSAPSVFIAAVMYGIWRVVEGNRLRAAGASGTAGGSPPSGSVNSGDQSAIAQRTDASGSLSESPGTKRVAWVLSFSSRGGPSRWVPRFVTDDTER